MQDPDRHSNPTVADEQPVVRTRPDRNRPFTRPLSESRINRSGLPKGATAPEFRLPLVSGGEIALKFFRNRRLLLIFSDPNCGPCRSLMPELLRIHQSTPDLEILMISRGDIEMVRQEVSRYPLSFPVAIQKRWEISRRYGMFATPIGYLVDEQGVIASDVALGAKAILHLLVGTQILLLLNMVKD